MNNKSILEIHAERLAKREAGKKELELMCYIAQNAIQGEEGKE